MERKLNVLFLCTGNSARSQMAEAFLRHLAGERFNALSAGTEPQPINPLTREVMSEAGISLDGQQSKGIEVYLGKIPVHHLVIVCEAAEGQCPRVWPGMLNREFWRFDDPAAATGTKEEQLKTFRIVRDEIRKRVERFLAVKS